MNQEQLNEIRANNWTNQEVADRFGLNLAQVYAIRDASRNIPIDDAKLLVALPEITAGIRSYDIKVILRSK
jgi:hypothetical protein